MRLVPEADRLQMLDGDHIADATRVDQLLQRRGVTRVAHHVGDGEQDARCLHCSNDGAAIVLRGRHGFLQQHVVTTLRQGDRGSKVQPVLRGDDHCIRDFDLAGCQVFPAGEHVLCGNAEALDQRLTTQGIGLGDRGDCHLVGMGFGKTRIPGTATAGTDDRKSHFVRGIAHVADALANGGLPGHI
jgi:hypothetical protein